MKVDRCNKRSSGHTPVFQWATNEDKEAAAEADLASDTEGTEEKQHNEPHIYVDYGFDDTDDDDSEPHIYVDHGYIADLAEKICNKIEASVQTEICNEGTSEVGVQTVMGLLDMRVVTVNIAHTATQAPDSGSHNTGEAQMLEPTLPLQDHKLESEDAEVESSEDAEHSDSETSNGMGESLVPQEEEVLRMHISASRAELEAAEAELRVAQEEVREELEAMSMVDLKEIITSKGLATGKKKDMIAAVVKSADREQEAAGEPLPKGSHCAGDGGGKRGGRAQEQRKGKGKGKGKDKGKKKGKSDYG